ncbi:hypothetical protein M231_02669 [Tremella mesenterica]|uniref:BHLH domain-containing protein n=1 Tax=Tremella mesenterica TaxID=5217 RepID=A0A4Q1BQ33_TREME|nr:hypothetical protein M231_02669 [Tremella mesenterica]
MQDQNRLTDFVQHVLREDDHDSSQHSAREAEHLLSFSEEGLFAPSNRLDELDGTHHETGVSIEQALERAEREDRIDPAILADGVGEQVSLEEGKEMEVRENGEGGQDGERGDGGNRWGRKRPRDDEGGEGRPKGKKESHADVERRRRDAINEGITAIAALIPHGSERSKGAILKYAAEHLSSITERVNRSDEEIARRDAEKAALQDELQQVQKGLAEEQIRSLKYERFWREAEDRSAASEFELQRLRGEIEDLKKGQ